MYKGPLIHSLLCSEFVELTLKRSVSGHIDLETDLNKIGSYLLSHLIGSTIGVDGLNFSVRDGKRWNTVALAT